MKKLACLLLSVLLLLGTLSGCEKRANPMAKSGFQELTIDEKERVNASVTLDLSTVQAHTGETVSLYELLPGEDTSVITSREPLDEARVEHTLSFRFPLKENGRTRLYSSFVVAFEDGSLLSTDGYYIQNPERLAVDTRAFPWASSPKGLNEIKDPADALSLGAMHATYEWHLDWLDPAYDASHTEGAAYKNYEEALNALDEKVLAADALGMQVSLILTIGTVPSPSEYAERIDTLISRYTKDGHCALTAILLDVPYYNIQADFAMLCRIASLALRARMAEGRIYVAPSGVTLDEAKTFFSTLQAQLLTGGEMQWGAAIAPHYESVVTPPEAEQAPLEPAAEDSSVETKPTLTGDELFELSEFLRKSMQGSTCSWFAVCGLGFSSGDRYQAASFAYAYRQAVSAKADLIFYNAHVASHEGAEGLRDENGEARRILSVFASIDTGLSADDRRLCEELIPVWNPDTKDLVSRLSVSGVANAGTIGLEENTLFDFTTGETYGFVGIGTTDPLKSNHSATWNAPTLFTWVDPLYGERGGICKRLDDATILQNTSAASIRLLCQIPEASTCTAHLTLEGTTEEGERLTYESNVKIKNGVWQTVTFQIGNFIADADLTKPVVMSLTTVSDSETDEPYTLWVNRIEVRRPTEQGLLTYLPAILIAGCLAVGFLATFLIYRKTKSRQARQK